MIFMVLNLTVARRIDSYLKRRSEHAQNESQHAYSTLIHLSPFWPSLWFLSCRDPFELHMKRGRDELREDQRHNSNNHQAV